MPPEEPRKPQSKPPLTTAQITALALRCRGGDTAAREKLIGACARLVRGCAKKYARYAVRIEMADLLDEGNLGVLEALNHYDVTRGKSFTAYARFWIIKELEKFIKEQSNQIYTPERQHHALAAWKHRRQYLAQELQREPTNAEIAAALDWSETQVKEVADALAAQNVGSFEQFFSAESYQQPDLTAPEPLTELVAAEETGDDFSIGEREQRKLCALLRGLRPRYAQVLRWRYGLDGCSHLTLAAIGKRLRPPKPLCRERVRQIEILALRQILAMFDEAKAREPVYKGE